MDKKKKPMVKKFTPLTFEKIMEILGKIGSNSFIFQNSWGLEESVNFGLGFSGFDPTPPSHEMCRCRICCPEEKPLQYIFEARCKFLAKMTLCSMSKEVEPLNQEESIGFNLLIRDDELIKGKEGRDSKFLNN